MDSPDLSYATLPSEQATPLRKIEDIRGDVGLRVLSHIASLKNVDSIQRLQRMMGDPKTSMNRSYLNDYQ